jgi:transcription elongation factor GreA
LKIHLNILFFEYCFKKPVFIKNQLINTTIYNLKNGELLMADSIELKKIEIKKELEILRHEFKIDLPKKISEARAYGDLKENAEYHAARERQSFVKAKISQLNSQLSQMNDIDLSKVEENKTGFGSAITVMDLDSNEKINFIFVHPNEVMPSEGKISTSSPIGAALTNKCAGDEVVINTPVGKKRFFIEKLVTIHGNEFNA